MGVKSIETAEGGFSTGFPNLLHFYFVIYVDG